jgi:hypothetical protein
MWCTSQADSEDDLNALLVSLDDPTPWYHTPRPCAWMNASYGHNADVPNFAPNLGAEDSSQARVHLVSLRVDDTGPRPH